MAKAYDILKRTMNRVAKEEDCEGDHFLVLAESESKGDGMVFIYGDHENFVEMFLNAFRKDPYLLMAAGEAASQLRQEIESTNNPNIN